VQLLVGVLVGACVVGGLAACTGEASHRIPSAATTRTAQSQRDALVTLYDAVEAQSGVVKWEKSDPPYPQACSLQNGSEGAMYNITKFGSTVDDSAATVKKVGAFLESKGMKISYNKETINNVTQYRVLATGGGVRSISFTADSTQTTLFGVSACGTGKESDLAGA
jgi:hypothetical protein